MTEIMHQGCTCAKRRGRTHIYPTRYYNLEIKSFVAPVCKHDWIEKVRAMLIVLKHHLYIIIVLSHYVCMQNIRIQRKQTQALCLCEFLSLILEYLSAVWKIFTSYFPQRVSLINVTLYKLEEEKRCHVRICQAGYGI